MFALSYDECSQVNKMGGEIKVVKKDSPGTLMQLYLVLSTNVDGIGQHSQIEFDEHGLMVSIYIYHQQSENYAGIYFLDCFISRRMLGKTSKWTKQAFPKSIVIFFFFFFQRKRMKFIKVLKIYVNKKNYKGVDHERKRKRITK